MRKLISKPLIAVTLAGVTICLVIIAASFRHNHIQQADQAYLTLLHEAYAAINKYYVESPDNPKLVISMVDGMLASLDPHSAYLPPEPYKEMEVQLSGAFGGIGLELGMKEGRLVVVAPIDDTPAFRAGIQPNDHIWKIDGALTRSMGIAVAVKRMRGEKGTPVTLSIVRGDNPQPFEFKLIRDIIKIKSIKSKTLEPGYSLIRIAQFQEQTGSEFRQALKDAKSAAGGQIKGLVIDLRYNPGGLLLSAIEVANCFIGDDLSSTLIVSTRGKSKDSNREFHATVGDKELRYPVVVLINGGSASASEIVAGALQDHKRAIVMGKQSFGKGSVQTIFSLPGNAALKLTTARYYTPRGRSIQAKGITPDIEVGTVMPVKSTISKEMGIKEKDLENRLSSGEGEEQSKPTSLSTSPHAVGAGADLLKDNQLNRALELLKSLTMVREQGFARNSKIAAGEK